MTLTANVAPTLGSAPVSLQAGNYGAIDDRRFWGSVASEGVLSGGSYNVTTTGSGLGLSVAASTGDGAIVQGDSVTGQGKYFVPPSSGALSVICATADATNPRNDLVVLEVKDDAHDASGLNLARVRIVTGTPNGSAAVGDGPGTNGAAALPSSCLLLATVCVAAGASTIAANRIRDRRNWSGGVPTFETSLPTPAANGQEIYYRADSTNGRIWHLRYRDQANGGSATYPWEYIGGSALTSNVKDGGIGDNESTNSTTYTALTTAGPVVTLPLAGDYEVTIGFTGYNTVQGGTTTMSHDIGGTAALDVDGVHTYSPTFSTGGTMSSAPINTPTRTRVKTGLSAVALTAKYKSSSATASSANFYNRFMVVRPIRVG